MTIPITSDTIIPPASLRSDHLIGIRRNADRLPSGTLIDFTRIRRVGCYNKQRLHKAGYFRELLETNPDINEWLASLL